MKAPQSGNRSRRGRRPGLPGGAKLRKLPARVVLYALMAACAIAEPPHFQEILMAQTSAPAAPQKPADTLTSAQLNDSMRKLETELLAKYGESQKARLSTGLHQVIQFWRPEDGEPAFSRPSSEPTSPATRILSIPCSIATSGCSNNSMATCMRSPANSASSRTSTSGPSVPIDEIFGGYDPSAHVIDDFFQNKLAFVVLLNFPLTTLEERLKRGPQWTRRQWAEARLAERFSSAFPPRSTSRSLRPGATPTNYIAELQHLDAPPR